jgi:hypothetical protein
MYWGNKAKSVKTVIVEPRIPSYIHKTIILTNPINLSLLDNPDIEWQPELKKPMTIKTEFGIIWIKSKNCIQITHVKNPDDLEKLERFIYNILFKDEKRSFIKWLREEWDKFEKELGLKK